MKISCFIFDLDGTLINSIADLTIACNSVLSKHDFNTIDENKCKLLAGYGFSELVALASESKDNELLQTMTKELYEAYEKQNDSNTATYDGIMQVLANDKFDHIKKAILTNKPDYLAQRCVAKFFGSIFDEVLGHIDSFAKKPNPQSALELAARLNCEPNQILIIGDTKTDIQTAKNAQMRCCGVTWGYRNKQELLDYQADFIVDTPSELAGVLEDLIS